MNDRYIDYEADRYTQDANAERLTAPAVALLGSMAGATLAVALGCFLVWVLGL